MLAMRINAFIAGCSGPHLTVEEARFYRNHNPWGFILFARNIESPDQVAALTAEMRGCTGRDDTAILIDQEGGRVQRLCPPHWRQYPAARLLGRVYSSDPKRGRRAAWLQSRLIASDLSALGINIDCLPVLDVPVETAHEVIGDRAYSHNPYEVSQLGRSACEGLLDGGVLPVVKHIPGHGRAMADSHAILPRVDTHPAILGCTDFYPFMQLADMPIAMTAHVVYSGFDAENPATTSPKMIGRIIRGWLGFDGLLLSDDLSMNALSGNMEKRTKSAFAAGCDLALHCNGDMEEMRAVADASPAMIGLAERRARLALERIGNRGGGEFDEAAARAELDELTGALS